MNGRIQGRRIRIRLSPSVAASLLTGLNPFLVNVTGQSGYELNGLSSGASNVCALGHEQKCSRSAALPPKGELIKPGSISRDGPKAAIRSPCRRECAWAHSGNPAFRSPSINSFAFDRPPRAMNSEIVKAGSTSSRCAAASRASASRPRWAKADTRQ